MRQEHRCAPSRQRTRPRRPAVASALCPGCPWPWQCARGRTKTWDAAPAPLSPAMPLPLWCAGEVVQRALTRAPRPGRQTAFARRSHHRHRCVGACGSGAGGVVGRAPRLRARSGETRFCGCLGNLGIVQFCLVFLAFPLKICLTKVKLSISLRFATTLRVLKPSTIRARTYKMVPFWTACTMGDPTVPLQCMIKYVIHYTCHILQFFG